MKQNVPQKHLHSHYAQNCHNGIDHWEVTLFEKCEISKQPKKGKNFWQHKLKTFCPFGLNETEVYSF